MKTVQRWPRPQWNHAGASAEVCLFTFAAGAVHGAPIEEEACAPAGEEPVLPLSLVTSPEATEWIANFFTGSLWNVALGDLDEWTLRELRASRACYVLRASFPDPHDLAYLQAAWIKVQRLLRAGATAVLDAHACWWRPRKEVIAWPSDRPFDPQREIRIMFETEPTAPFGYLVHTRGLRKFGRPDLIYPGRTKEEAAAHAQALQTIAASCAEGRLIGTGPQIEFQGRLVDVVEYVPGENGPELELNNDGLLLSARTTL
jgi:hypothetical protein